MKVIYRMDGYSKDSTKNSCSLDAVIHRTNRVHYVKFVLGGILDKILKFSVCNEAAILAMIRTGDTGRLTFAHLKAKQNVHVKFNGGKCQQSRQLFQLEHKRLDLEFSVYRALAERAPDV